MKTLLTSYSVYRVKVSPSHVGVQKKIVIKKSVYLLDQSFGLGLVE